MFRRLSKIAKMRAKEDKAEMMRQGNIQGITGKHENKKSATNLKKVGDIQKKIIPVEPAPGSLERINSKPVDPNIDF